jgi:hypothetical protein
LLRRVLLPVVHAQLAGPAAKRCKKIDFGAWVSTPTEI